MAGVLLLTCLSGLGACSSTSNPPGEATSGGAASATAEGVSEAEQAQRLSTWLDAVRPLEPAVIHLVQPLSSALARYGGDFGPPRSDLRDDVLAASTAPEQLQVLRRRLLDVTPPTSRDDQHRALLVALTTLRNATLDLQQAAASVLPTEVVDERAALQTAIGSWRAALGSAIGPAVVPGEGRPDRPPQESVEAYLFRVGPLCLAINDAFEELLLTVPRFSDESYVGEAELGTRGMDLYLQVPRPPGAEVATAAESVVGLRRMYRDQVIILDPNVSSATFGALIDVWSQDRRRAIDALLALGSSVCAESLTTTF